MRAAARPHALSIECNGLTELLRTHCREAVMRIDLARTCQEEFRKSLRGEPAQWIHRLSHRNGRRVSFRVRDGDHAANVRIRGRIVLRQTMENYPAVAVAVCDRMRD